MKLSNKLLIAFASVLILIPLMGMIYISQVNYKKGDFASEDSMRRKVDDHFNMPSENMLSKAISTPFKAVNIVDAKGVNLVVNIMVDKSFGVKVPTDYQDQIDLKVDDAGTLQISLKEGKSNGNNYIRVYIYAPNIDQLSLANAGGLTLYGTIDSLNLFIKKARSIDIDSESKLQKLTVTAEDVKRFDAWEDKVNSLSLNLKNSNFTSNRTSYNNLSITTEGKSKIDIDGEKDHKEEHSINSLTINTFGETEVSLSNIKINNCSGSFSDQTKVQMPAVNLNQMFKK